MRAGLRGGAFYVSYGSALSDCDVDDGVSKLGAASAARCLSLKGRRLGERRHRGALGMPGETPMEG